MDTVDFDQDLQKKKISQSSSDEEQVIDSCDLKKEIINGPSEKSTQSPYHEILSNPKVKQRLLSEMIKILEQGGVKFNSQYELLRDRNDHNAPSLKILSISNTKHYQIVNLNVALGPYQLEVKIYNTFTSFVFVQENLVYFGKMTNIYNLTYNKKQLVVKSISITNLTNNSFSKKREQIFFAIKQYCICKIMSILRIGPYIANELYFDVFITENDVFFIMQQCQNPKNRYFQEEDEIILQMNLKQIHSLQFLHRDIKPENIMYSPAYHKFVFIDFGISEYRNQHQGQLIYTSFAGTYSYCTEEMKRLFKFRQKSWVDLHLNDAHGLSLSISEMKGYIKFQQIFQSEKKSKKQQYIHFDFLFEIKLKYFFLMNTISDDQDFDQIENMSLSFLINLMTFMYQVPLTQQIRKFYNIYLQEPLRKIQLFQDLKDIFDSPIYFESCKGKRQIIKKQEKQIYEKIQSFYKEVKAQLTQKIQKKVLSIHQSQQILFSLDNILKQETLEYNFLIIDYINFKRIEPLITLEKKIEVCCIYIQNNKLKEQKQFKNLKDIQIVLVVLKDILLKFDLRKIMETFQNFIKCLQNYLLLSKHIDSEIFSLLDKVIQSIEVDPIILSLIKVERTLLIFLDMHYISQKYITVSTYQGLLKLSKCIKAKLRNYVQNLEQNDSQDFKVTSFLLDFISYFELESNSPKLQYKINLHQNCNRFRPDYPTLSLFFDFIEYRALISSQKINRLKNKRRQKQQIIYEQMENKKEINVLIFYLIKAYGFAEEKKVAKKYFNLFDSTVKIQDVFYASRIDYRIIFLMSAFEQEDRVKKQEQLSKLLKINSLILQVKYENLICFLKLLQNASAVFPNVKHSVLQTMPELFKQFYKKMQEKISQFVELYESFQKPIQFQKSMNLFHLKLLYEQFEVQRKRKLESLNLFVNSFEQYWYLYYDLESFQKISSISRENFSFKDHVFVMLFDLIKLKKIYSTEQALDYFFGKRQMIIFCLQSHTIQQRTWIFSSLSMLLHFIINEDNEGYMIKCIDFIYPFVKNNFANTHLGCRFPLYLTQILVRTLKFDFILDEVIQMSIYYGKNASSLNIANLSVFFNFIVIKRISANLIDERFHLYLQNFLPQIKIKEYPLLSIFLLCCIKNFNRAKIIRIVIESLPLLKQKEAKYIVHSRLYKQLLKLEDFTLRKKKNFMRRDFRFPGALYYNLQKLRSKLNCLDELSLFKEQFESKLNKKIVKWGKLCQIYNQNKQYHPINYVLNHDYLDYCRTSSNFQNIQYIFDFFHKQNTSYHRSLEVIFG